MELAERRLLLTSLTDIGVKGVNVLPTKNKMTKLKKRTTQNRKKILQQQKIQTKKRNKVMSTEIKVGQTRK